MSEMLMFWLVLLIIAIVAEVLTMGLATIWFAGGALVAIVVAILHGPIWLQVVLFLLVSLVLLFFTRPIAVKYFNKDRVKTNVESMVGCQAVVTSEICNLHGIGQVTVGGQEWSARSTVESLIIPVGTVVEVVEINGVKLMVKPTAQAEAQMRGKEAVKPEPLSVSEIEEMESQNSVK